MSFRFGGRGLAEFVRVLGDRPGDKKEYLDVATLHRNVNGTRDQIGGTRRARNSARHKLSIGFGIGRESQCQGSIWRCLGHNGGVWTMDPGIRDSHRCR